VTVDLYNTSYGNYARDVYRDVRLATYGEDFGQTSWVATEESHDIPRRLGLTNASSVVEIGSGSGRYALHLVETIGCRVTGVDVNAEGVRNAVALAERQRLNDRAEFRQADVSRGLPFADRTADAVYSNDVLCHVPGRAALLRECARILEPGGRLLFSDALEIAGIVSNAELATRSSIGRYFFVPPGENARLIAEAGLRLVEARDATAAAAAIAARWRDARAARAADLIELEGQATFDGLQAFLSCVHSLTSERRMLRTVYLAQA
jgi:SAM-dependent methyltransferase